MRTHDWGTLASSSFVPDTVVGELEDKELCNSDNSETFYKFGSDMKKFILT